MGLTAKLMTPPSAYADTSPRKAWGGKVRRGSQEQPAQMRQRALACLHRRRLVVGRVSLAIEAVLGARIDVDLDGPSGPCAPGWPPRSAPAHADRSRRNASGSAPADRPRRDAGRSGPRSSSPPPRSAGACSPGRRTCRRGRSPSRRSCRCSPLALAGRPPCRRGRGRTGRCRALPTTPAPWRGPRRCRAGSWRPPAARRRRAPAREPVGRVAVGDRADVRVGIEHLGQHDQAGRRKVRRQRQIRGEAPAVRCRQRDFLAHEYLPFAVILRWPDESGQSHCP